MKIFTKVLTISILLFYFANVNAQDFIEQNNKVKLYSIENKAPKLGGTELTLNQNYPNPFDSRTSFEFSIPGNNLTTLIIYNILGKEVVTLVHRELKAGWYRVDWDARTVPKGTYFFRLQSGDNVKSKILHKEN